MYQGGWSFGRRDGRGAWFGADGYVYDGMWSAGRAPCGAVHRRIAGTGAPGMSGYGQGSTYGGLVLVWQYRAPSESSGPVQHESVRDVLSRLADAQLRDDVAGLVRAAARGHVDGVKVRVIAGCDVKRGAPADLFATESSYANNPQAAAPYVHTEWPGLQTDCNISATDRNISDQARGSGLPCVRSIKANGMLKVLQADPIRLAPKH